jgi:hypothetical protein
VFRVFKDKNGLDFSCLTNRMICGWEANDTSLPSHASASATGGGSFSHGQRNLLQIRVGDVVGTRPCHTHRARPPLSRGRPTHRTVAPPNTRCLSSRSQPPPQPPPHPPRTVWQQLALDPADHHVLVTERATTPVVSCPCAPLPDVAAAMAATRKT